MPDYNIGGLGGLIGSIGMAPVDPRTVPFNGRLKSRSRIPIGGAGPMAEPVGPFDPGAPIVSPDDPAAAGGIPPQGGGGLPDDPADPGQQAMQAQPLQRKAATLPQPPLPPNSYDEQGNLRPGSQHIGLGRKIGGMLIQGLSPFAGPGAGLAQHIGQDLSQGDYPKKLEQYGQNVQRAGQQAALDKTAAETAKTAAEATEAGQRGGYYAGENQRARDVAQIGADTRKEVANTQATQRHMAALLKPYGGDEIQQKEGDPVPQGYETIQDLENPGFVYVVPPRFMKLTDDLAPYAKGRKSGDVIPYSEFRRVQDAAAKDTLQQNKPVKPDKMDQVGLAIRAAGGNPEDPATVTPDVAKKAAAILKPQMPGVALTPEAVQFWAQAAAQGIPLPSLGMGASGAVARGQIINAAPGASGGVPLVEARAAQRANTGSLAKVVTMRDAVVSFENTANKNLDIFTGQAKRVIDSGSPWINQPLRSINRNALGNTDVPAFDAARQVALTEIAKVVNNPSLSSVLSDTARKEVLSLIPENATLAQIYRVVNVLKQDMANRHSSLDQQIQEIDKRMGGATQQLPGATQTPAAGSGNPAVVATPNGTVDLSKFHK